jgi:undecaprenyl-diphosphatase
LASEGLVLGGLCGADGAKDLEGVWARGCGRCHWRQKEQRAEQGGKSCLYTSGLVHKHPNLDEECMDQKLLLLINREWTAAWLDWVMAGASSLNLWMGFLAVAALWVAVRGGVRARLYLVALVMVVALNDGVVSRTLKHAVGRLRPGQSADGVRMVELEGGGKPWKAFSKPVRVRYSRAQWGAEGRSFPSSHTVNLFSVAVVSGVFWGGRGWWALLPAGLVGYSRIYTGAHWPSDVLASVFLGVGASFIWVAAVFRVWEWGTARWAPGWAERFSGTNA